MKKKEMPKKADKRIRLMLTPEIQSLYFQCFEDSPLNLTTRQKRLVVTVFNQQFPILKKQAAMVTPPSGWKMKDVFFYTVAFILLLLFAFGLLQRFAGAIEPDNVVRIPSGFHMVGKDGAGNPIIEPEDAQVHKSGLSAELIDTAQQQAADSLRQAWRNGTEGESQPVDTVIDSEGSIALVQNAPKRIITRPDGSLDISNSHTTITIIPQPTALPPVAPQDSRIQTTVDGIDHIETKAILPETLVVDQLDAVKKIADNGTLIAQQRFAVEQYKMNSDAGLEYLRIVRNFILWGFLASIPFIITVYWIFKNLLSGYHALQKDRLDHKLKELESAERQIAMTESRLHNRRRE